MNWRDTPHTRKLFSIIKISFQSTAQTSPERTDARRLGYGYRKKRKKKSKNKNEKALQDMLGKIDEGKHKTHLRWFGHAPIQKKNDKKKMTVLG